MEMIGGNDELAGPGRRRSCLVGGEPVEAKCVKRRRREPPTIALSSGDQKGGEQQQVVQLKLQGDQQPAATPTATTVKRSSRFRGVSRHRWTGRYEAHLWDKASWNPTQRKKGKQVYLGAYDEEESAARAYDLAALKYWGTSTFTNFPVFDYEKEIEIMKALTKEEYLASLRRRSSGFSRGVSKYRGVARHHHNGRWEARIGRVFGNKYLYLGTYGTQEEAAHAYDIAAIEYRGINAVTNFDLSTYLRWLKPAEPTYNPPLTPRESKPVLEPLPMANYSFPREETPQLMYLQPNPYGNRLDDFNSPRTTNIFAAGKSPISPCSTKSSSPTALSLLLKSSVFKELVEKNSSAIQEETDEKDCKNIFSTSKNNAVEDYFYKGEFFPRLNVCPSSEGLDSKEECLLPLWYNK